MQLQVNILPNVTQPLVRSSYCVMTSQKTAMSYPSGCIMAFSPPVVCYWSLFSCCLVRCRKKAI